MSGWLVMIWRVAIIGGHGLLRNLWLTIASVMIMIITLTVGLAAVILNLAANNLVTSLSENLKVSIYLSEETTVDQTFELQTALAANPAVSQIEFISSAEVQAEFLKSFDSETIREALDLIDKPVFAASLRVGLSDLSQVAAVERIASQADYSSLVSSLPSQQVDFQSTIARAQSLGQSVNQIGLITVIVFALVATLVVFNTVRITIFSRRGEIEVMKLVGARAVFVRWIFLAEAALIGLIAGLGGIFLIYSAFGLVEGWLGQQEHLANTDQLFEQTLTWLKLIGVSLAAGLILSLTSAYIAVSRYLRY